MKADINELREVIAVLPLQHFSDEMYERYKRKGYEISYCTKDNAVRIYGYDKQTEYSMRGFWEVRR